MFPELGYQFLNLAGAILRNVVVLSISGLNSSAIYRNVQYDEMGSLNEGAKPELSASSSLPFFVAVHIIIRVSVSLGCARSKTRVRCVQKSVSGLDIRFK